MGDKVVVDTGRYDPGSKERITELNNQLDAANTKYTELQDQYTTTNASLAASQDQYASERAKLTEREADLSASLDALGVLQSDFDTQGDRIVNRDKLDDNYAGVMDDTRTDLTDMTEPDFGRYDEEGNHKYIKDSETVRGQLSSLLAEDSEYIQQARLGAREEAAKGGVAHTSMAAGAGQREAIKAGLNVATPDALAYSQSAMQEQSATDISEADVARTELSGRLKEQMGKINANLSQVQGIEKEYLAGVEDTFARGRLKLESTLADASKELEYDQRNAESFGLLSESALESDSVFYETIMTNPTYIAMMGKPGGADAVNKVLADHHEFTVSRVQFGAKSLQIDDDTLNNFLLNWDNEWQSLGTLPDITEDEE